MPWTCLRLGDWVAIVETGSLGHFFGAVEKMAEGNVSGAVGELGQTIASLMAYGDKIKLGPFDTFFHTFGPYELPFSEQGIGLIGLSVPAPILRAMRRARVPRSGQRPASADPS